MIVPRYGEGLGGGAEALMRQLALDIVSPKDSGPLVGRLEVWTTCAKDHRTWNNELPAGETIEDGITVRRFPVDTRDVEIFLRHEISMREGRPLDSESQLEWLKNSVNSRALYEHIARVGSEFDLLLFAPYLFATTFWGGLIYPERSVIVPCLHNEHYAYQGVFRFLFETVRGLIFNSAPELELAMELYDISNLEKKSAVVGMAFAPKEIPAKKKPALERKPYLLYSGRKERGKNLDLLIHYFQQFKERTSSTLELVIMGAGEIDFCNPLPPGVVDVGFVSEEEKETLMSNALALCQPSLNESFSIVLMEAWLMGTPVIVHGDCSVTKYHVMKSGGGLYFSSVEEFSMVVHKLEKDKDLKNQLGAAGKRYVEEEYCSDAVIGRLFRAFDKFNVRYEEGRDETESKKVASQLEVPTQSGI